MTMLYPWLIKLVSLLTCTLAKLHVSKLTSFIKFDKALTKFM